MKVFRPLLLMIRHQVLLTLQINQRCPLIITRRLKHKQGNHKISLRQTTNNSKLVYWLKLWKCLRSFRYVSIRMRMMLKSRNNKRFRNNIMFNLQITSRRRLMMASKSVIASQKQVRSSMSLWKISLWIKMKELRKNLLSIIYLLLRNQFL